MWLNMSENILQSTLKKENCNWTINEINLWLESTLVMGLTPEPTIQHYFEQDNSGIFGLHWM
jgi:hypothetical protein